MIFNIMNTNYYNDKIYKYVIFKLKINIFILIKLKTINYLP